MGKERLDAKFDAAAIKLFIAQQKFKEAQNELKETKEKSHKVFSAYFERTGKSDCMVDGVDAFDVCGNVCGNGSALKVQSVKRVTIHFDADKLEKAMDKSLALQVVSKRYEVDDMPGLVAYVKSLGADPKIFKSFLHVEKRVNEDELNRLSELGKIADEDVEGCYTTSVSEHFTMRVVKARGE